MNAPITWTAGLLCVALLGGVPVVSAAADQASAKSACSAAKLAEVLEPASDKKRSVEVDCHLKLAKGQVVTKQIRLSGRQASGVRLECGGATLNGANGQVNAGKDMLLIRSLGKTPEEMQANRPENIEIRDCRVIGSIRVHGLGLNGEGEMVRASSRSAGHTARARAAAPTRITFVRLDLVGQSRVPLYLAPGVTQVTVTDSELSGEGTSAAIYMDAESGNNTIVRNKIHVKNEDREQIAVDGSAGNLIAENRFGSLSKGGIYLYRNCGEGGTIRHQAPQNNVIRNNTFYYKKYRGSNPAVWLGSRNGNRNYCGHDKGQPFGSSASDADHADNNAVMDNTFVNRSARDLIRDNGQNNKIERN